MAMISAASPEETESSAYASVRFPPANGGVQLLPVTDAGPTSVDVAAIVTAIVPASCPAQSWDWSPTQQGRMRQD